VSAGGGIDNVTHLTVTNSTIADNSATGTGGGIDNRGTATITNSTIASNLANDDGGGINNETGGTATLNNTIVALNTIGAAADDISVSVSPSSAYNLFGT
jgi:hypothetical protein